MSRTPLAPMVRRAHPDRRAGDTLSADICPVDTLSFWRIVNVPFEIWTAALERWQLTAANSELRLGQSLLRGPIEHDRHFGTCRIGAHLDRGRCARRCGCGSTSTAGPPWPPPSRSSPASASGPPPRTSGPGAGKHPARLEA